MREHHDPDFRLSATRPVPLVTDGKLGLDITSRTRVPLKLGAYMTEPTTEPPAAVSRKHANWTWDMLGNDRYGDCAPVMALHSIQDFVMDAGKTPPAFTITDALSVYSDVAGFNPNDPSTDHGTSMNNLLAGWKSGFMGHQIVDFVEIDPTSLEQLHVGVYEFVAVQLAVALPATAQGQYSWDLVGNPKSDPQAAPGSWGGHAVPIREYDQTGFTVVTWGNELHMTNAFATTYIYQAFVVLTKDMLSNTGVSPTGVSWDDLVTDAKKL